MLRTKIRRGAEEGVNAINRLAKIEASIAALNDEDLLDLADIFPQDTKAFLGTAASAELERRNLTPEVC